MGTIEGFYEQIAATDWRGLDEQLASFEQLQLATIDLGFVDENRGSLPPPDDELDKVAQLFKRNLPHFSSRGILNLLPEIPMSVGPISLTILLLTRPAD